MTISSVFKDFFSHLGLSKLDFSYIPLFSIASLFRSNQVLLGRLLFFFSSRLLLHSHSWKSCSSLLYSHVHIKRAVFLELPSQMFHWISSPSYYVWGTLVIVQNFDVRFLANLHVLGSGDSKKHKISMVSGCSLVSMLVCLLEC